MKKVDRSFFFKRFNPKADYVVVRPFMTGGVNYEFGMPFDKSSVPERKVKTFFEARKITFAEAIIDVEVAGHCKSKTIEVAEEVKNEAKLEPKIVRAGPVWIKVMVGNEQIGKSVKSFAEAKEVAENWKKANG